MKITSITAALGAALLLAGAPALASADETTSAPIMLDNVQIEQPYGPKDQFSPGLVTVAFTNENNSPATDVVFDIQANGKIVGSFEDVGSYAKGESVRHSFPDFEDDDNQSVVVDNVTFADGSSWSRPYDATTLDVPSPAQMGF